MREGAGQGEGRGGGREKDELENRRERWAERKDNYF